MSTNVPLSTDCRKPMCVLVPYDPSAHLEMLRQLLRRQRKYLGLTQQAVATHLGISKSHLLKWERGKTLLDLPLLLRLCHALALPGWVLLPPPPGAATALLLPLIAQLPEHEQLALATVLQG